MGRCSSKEVSRLSLNASFWSVQVEDNYCSGDCMLPVLVNTPMFSIPPFAVSCAIFLRYCPFHFLAFFLFPYGPIPWRGVTQPLAAGYTTRMQMGPQHLAQRVGDIVRHAPF